VTKIWQLLQHFETKIAAAGSQSMRYFSLHFQQHICIRKNAGHGPEHS
jgi:hypothetical protein